MIVAVTGASGFIGGRIAQVLQSEGHEVRRLDVRPGDGVIHADITSLDDWAEAFDDVDVVVHAAAAVGELGTASLHWRVNVEGTRNVIAVAKQRGVGRLVHLSSLVVYGAFFAAGVDETVPPRPSGTPYTDTKIVAEHLVLQAAAEGAQTVILRLGDVYGPGSVPWTIRPIELLKKRLLVVPTGGRITPTYIDDVVRGLVLAVEQPVARGEIFNITGDEAIPPADFFRPYADALGTRLPTAPALLVRPLVRLVEGAFRATGRSAPVGAAAIEYVTHEGAPSNSKAERLLGWRPEVDLATGMEATIAWAREENLLPRSAPTA